MKRFDLQESAAAETYRDVERLLDKLSWDQTRKWGGDWDEWRSLANEAFMQAYQAFDPARGRFTTLVHWCVTNRFRSEVAAGKKRRERETKLPEDVTDPAAEIRDRNAWVDEVSEDARLVARMVLDTPRELVEATLGHRVDEVLGGIRYTLAQLGWGQDRATAAFVEIKEALPCGTR
jgi:DNA-directed RNA polymerase specialized sigma24 family protein